MANITHAVHSLLRKKFITVEDHNQAVRHLVKYRDTDRLQSAYPSNVSDAICWEDSDEGSEFWRRIYNAY